LARISSVIIQSAIDAGGQISKIVTGDKIPSAGMVFEQHEDISLHLRRHRLSGVEWNVNVAIGTSRSFALCVPCSTSH